MEKRILLAFALSLAVLYGFRVLFPPQQPPTQPPPPTAQAAPAAAAPQVNQPTAQPKPAVTPVATTRRQEAPTNEDVIAAEIENVSIETPLYSATLSNQGAVLKSFRLFFGDEHKPTEVIDATGGAKIGWPLAIVTLDPKLDQTLNMANFKVSRDGDQVVMAYASNGIRARKSIVFDRENYTLHVQSSLTRAGEFVPHKIVWQSGFGDQSLSKPDVARHQVIYSNNGTYSRQAFTSIKEPQDVTTMQAGIEDGYFLAMLFMETPSARITKAEYPGADGKAVVTARVEAPASQGGPGIQIYVGPKSKKWLVQTDPQLERVISDYYGWFEFIAKPLTLALMWLNSYVGNFGWSIVLLTVFINFALFPLRLKQQLSMQKMAKIQPHMNALQDKYKKLKATDPKRAEVQAQMLDLYKQHGVNPMGGCLPLLLQMPFLIAFWRVFPVAIELRQAPWMLWIKDLSIADPLYILPILMAVTMFISQKMTPTTMDPAQAKMMMIMPVMMSVLFISQSAGLVLYMVTGNVVGIVQQTLIGKYWGSGQEPKRKRDKKTDPAE